MNFWKSACLDMDIWYRYPASFNGLACLSEMWDAVAPVCQESVQAGCLGGTEMEVQVDW